MEGLLTGCRTRKRVGMNDQSANSTFVLRRFCQKELASVTFWRDALCEFLASFFYTIVVCGINFDWTPPNTTHIAVSTGLGVAMLAHMFWDLSGGHFNPALSIAMVFARKISPLRGIAYVASQVAGNLTGVGVLHVLTPVSLRGNFAALELGRDVTPIQGFFMEIILTAIMMWTILVSIRPEKTYQEYIAPLAIGFCVTVNLFIGIPYTGAAMNPIRAFGPAVASGQWDNHWIYWTAPILSAVGTVGLYYVISEIMDSPRETKKDFSDVVQNRSVEDMETAKD